MNTHKPMFSIILFLATALSHVSGQTNVSGGIFSNTTWTKANSPYIVTDTVVVFANVTLTIEPGVEVRFNDDMMLEIRQGQLVAIGTSVDSITFTSNSASPVPGSWMQVWLNNGNMLSEFDYCNFHYAYYGINGTPATITHSVFSFNEYGINGNVIVTHSDFSFNNFGISGFTPSLTHSSFSFNNYGCALYDSVFVSNCDFFSNTTYGLMSTMNFTGFNQVNIATFINCNFWDNGIGIGFGGDGGGNFINCVSNNNTIGVVLMDAWLFGNLSKWDNCVINHNGDGIIGGDDTNLNIKNSIIDSNSRTGLLLTGYSDSVINCQITSNGIGVYDSLSQNAYITESRIEGNTIGVKWRGGSSSQLTCNKICNNSSYDFYRVSSLPCNISDNYWCTTDSATIAAKIYDAYDNINLGIVTFMPLDTSQCYLGAIPVSISGAILTETGVPVSGVTVTLSGDDSQTYITDITGRYSFTVGAGDSYNIIPSKSNDVVTNNGITSVDVLLMRRHILGIAPLGSPYKIIAAAECNAAGDTLVSTADILLTRQLILGQSTSYPTSRLWQFVSSDYVFPDAINPFPFPTTRTYTNITINQTGQDFIGIKLGDVNGSWDAGTP